MRKFRNKTEKKTEKKPREFVVSKRIKKLYREAVDTTYVSLKTFARSEDCNAELAATWFVNKESS